MVSRQDSPKERIQVKTISPIADRLDTAEPLPKPADKTEAVAETLRYAALKSPIELAMPIDEVRHFSNTKKIAFALGRSGLAGCLAPR